MFVRPAPKLRARTLFHGLLASFALFAASGCSHNWIAKTALGEVGTRADAADCHVWLHARQTATVPRALIRDVPTDNVGALLVERVKVGEKEQLREGVCLQRGDGPLVVPQPITVAFPTNVAIDSDDFCPDRPQHEKLQVGKQEIEVKTCRWSSFYHAVRPFSFWLSTTDTLSKYVALVRIFRNGELVYSWNAANAATKAQLKIDGESLNADSRLASRSLPPHLADFELRIVPSQVQIDPAQLAMTVVDSRAQSTERWQSLGFSVLAVVEKTAGPDVLGKKQCLVSQLRELEDRVLRLVDGTRPSLPMPINCTPLPVKIQSATPLTDVYKGLERKTTEALDEATNKLEAALGGIDCSGLEDAVKKAVNDALSPDLQPAERAHQVAELDGVVQAALGSVQRARELANSIRARAVAIGGDPAAQAQAANDLVRAFEAQPDIFEVRRANPPVVEGERTLKMRYGDAFQGFMFSPWFGVPFRIIDSPGAAFEATVAVPIIDVLGARWQFGKSRLSDVRLAIGIAGFLDKQTNRDGSNGNDVFHVASEASLGFGTVKAALGLVMNDKDSFEHKQSNRLRLIVGADLLKLITGKNVELL